MVESTNNQQINTFTGGMDLDTATAYLKPDTYREAYNLRVTTDTNSNTGVLHNIEGVKFDVSFVLSTLGILGHWDIQWTGTIRDYGLIIAVNNVREVGQNIGNVAVFRFKHSEESSTHPAVRLFCSDPNKMQLSYENGLSCVTRYEDEDNIKLYVADGENPIRVWNVAPSKDSFNQSLKDDSSLSVYPSVTFDRPEFLGFGKGVLSAGTYQFGYQLFNKNGSETEVSPLTGLIYVNDGLLNFTSSTQCVGTLKGKGTNKSIKLKIDVPDKVNYTRVKVVSLFWEDRNELPHVQVVQDATIPASGTVYYEVLTNTGVRDLSLEEFNMITNVHFAPRLLESKNNYLFASNIKYLDNNIDVDFDARAYRFHYGSNSLKTKNACILQSGNGVTTPILSQANFEALQFSLAEDYDAINPFNDTSKTQQLYYTEPYDKLSEAQRGDLTRFKCNSFIDTDGNTVIGGIGKNIKYKFLVGDLEEVTQNSNGTPLRNDILSSEAALCEGMWVANVTPTGTFVNSKFIPLSFATTSTKNYSNPQISYSFKSLQRDEIYRYGIILYDKHGSTSPVKWIGDIRTPSMSDPGFETFQTRRTVSFTSSGTDKHDCELAVRPLGIEFEVNNLPSNIVAYEIVRCERTESDRSVLTQGLISRVGLMNVNGDKYANKIFPQEMMHFSKYNRLYTSSVPEISKTLPCDNPYFCIASPEISYSNKSFTNYVNDSSLRIEVKKALLSCLQDGQGGATAAFTSKSVDDKQGKIQWADYTSVNDRKLWYYSPDISYNVFKPYLQSNSYTTPSGATTDGSQMMMVGSSYSIEKALLPRDLSWSDYSSRNEYAEGFDGYNYVNWVEMIFGAISLPETAINPTGPGGRKLVFKSSNLHQSVGSIEKVDTFAQSYLGVINAEIKYSDDAGRIGNLIRRSATLLCNIKRTVVPYGGNTYQSRQFSRYITNGSYKVKSSNNKITVFDGDTFIGAFDYINMHYGVTPVTEEQWENPNPTPVIYYIPVESSINLSLTNNEEYHRIKKPQIQLEPSNVNGVYIQTEPSYVYNSVYSVQATGKEYVPSNQYDEYGKTMDFRTYHAEPKSNDEIIDSWTKFKPLNYIDVDTRYGSINNIRTFGNELIFWQDYALGKFSVLERTMITDDSNAPLLLGTGGILSRYDYVATVNGIKKGHHDCDTQSDEVLYWFDQDKQEICSYSHQGVTPISKTGRVQSYVKRLVKENKDLRDRPFLEYDKQYNELLCCLSEKDTLIYNEALGNFTGFYTIIPDYAMTFSKNTFLVKDNSLYYYNSDTINSNFDGSALPIEFKYVVNNPYTHTKVFDNAEFTGLLNKKNILGITCSTETMTGDIITPSNITDREYNFRFAIPRLKTSVEYPNRLRGRYLECVFKYDLVAQDTVFIVSNEDDYLNTYDDKYMVANRPAGSSQQVSRQLKYYTITGADAETFELPYIRTTFRVSKS